MRERDINCTFSKSHDRYEAAEVKSANTRGTKEAQSISRDVDFVLYKWYYSLLVVFSSLPSCLPYCCRVLGYVIRPTPRGYRRIKGALGEFGITLVNSSETIIN